MRASCWLVVDGTGAVWRVGEEAKDAVVVRFFVLVVKYT